MDHEMDYSLFDDDDEDFLRLLNDEKKRKLEEEYGMISSYAKPTLPPEASGQRLDYIIEFERQWEQAKPTTVRKFIGNPPITPLTEIAAPEEVETSLYKLIDIMASHNVYLHTLCDVEITEIYRFITEELLDKEIYDIRIEGTNLNFTYEEFHPNDEYDGKMWAEYFLRFLFERNREPLVTSFDKEELYDSQGVPISEEEMERRLDAFLAENSLIANFHFDILTCQVDGDYATVKAATHWECLKAESMEMVTHTGDSTIRLKRSPYGGWEVIQANVVGWNY